MEESITPGPDNIVAVQTIKTQEKTILNDIFSLTLMIIGTGITSFWYLREIGWWGYFSNTFDSSGIYEWVYQVDPFLGYHGIIFLIAPLLFMGGAVLLHLHHRESRWEKVPLIVAFSIFILWLTVLYAGSSEYMS